eukprot:m51a1_g13571 hypothetical protein (106) ;mRNA; f:52-369
MGPATSYETPGADSRSSPGMSVPLAHGRKAEHEYWPGRGRAAISWATLAVTQSRPPFLLSLARDQAVHRGSEAQHMRQLVSLRLHSVTWIVRPSLSSPSCWPRVQ